MVPSPSLHATESLGDFATPSPPAEKATAREDQARQSGTSDGTGNGHAVEHKGCVKRSLASDIGADPQPIGVNTSITVISCPALKIGEAGSASR